MDIYQRLKQDHDEHRQLAKQIAETSGASEERQRLWKAFKPDVEAHANAEEQTFYAALIERPDSQEKVRHSVSEHKEAADLLDELEETDMSSPGWLPKFEKLKEELEHHMKEEENEVFAKAKKVLDRSTAKSMVRDFEARKKAE